MADQTARMPTPGEEIEAGEHVYTIGRMLGAGAFGRVFECTDVWGNELAAKVLLPQDRTYEEVKAEWQREIKALLEHRHPNVTFIYDAFEHMATFYLVIERCETTMADVIKLVAESNEGPESMGGYMLPAIARDVLQALHWIHGLGWVHKDIHPGNVFVRGYKDPLMPKHDSVWVYKVGDLGISRLASDIRTVGTVLAPWQKPPEAIAPEEFGVVGPEVDVYHAALLFLALLRGRVESFSEEEILDGVPRDLAEQLPSPYAKPLARALRRHVPYRTKSVYAMWQELRAATTQ